jgi:phosphonate transport system substrate-binding protein
MARLMVDATSPIQFAIVSGAPAAQALLLAVCEQLAKHVDREVAPLVLRTYGSLADEMKAGKVHLAWAPPLLAIDLERAGSAKVALCTKRAGRVDYQAALFVPKGSPIAAPEGMKGRRIAWVAKESAAGYIFPRLKLASLGLDPETTFSEESFRRTHEAVVRAVLDGNADVGATYVSHGEDGAVVSAGWLEAGTPTEAVRVLLTAGPIPADVIAFSASLDAPLADRLGDGLRALGKSDSIRALLNADGFEPASSAHFDELRRLVTGAGAVSGAEAPSS